MCAHTHVDACICTSQMISEIKSDQLGNTRDSFNEDMYNHSSKNYFDSRLVPMESSISTITIRTMLDPLPCPIPYPYSL